MAKNVKGNTSEGVPKGVEVAIQKADVLVIF